MTRRELLQEFGVGLAASSLLNAAPAGPVESLSGTQPLTWDGDLAERLMDGAHQFVERQIAGSTAGRLKYWNRDLSSRAAYEKSVEPNRRRFAIPEYSNSHPNAQETKMVREFARLVLSGTPDESWPKAALQTQEVMERCLHSSQLRG